MNSLRVIVRLFVFLGAFSTFGQPGGPPNNRTASENGKFAVEVSETEINKPLLAVFERDGSAFKLLWSRSLVAKSDLDEVNISVFQGGRQINKAVSNDGKVVLLRPQYANNDEPAARILTQSGGDASFTGDDLSLMLVDQIEDDPQNALSNSQGALEVFAEDARPPVFAFWVPQARKWLQFDLEKLSASVASGGTEARLNKLGLEKARELVKDKQSGRSLSQALGALRRRVAQVLPGVMEEQAEQPDPMALRNAYLFLAAQKQPEDRPSIERLLEGKIAPSAMFSPYDDLRLGGHSWERALGEELLAEWDGKPLEEKQAGSRWSFNTRESRRFGTLRGKIYLPFKAPPQSGPLWFYLVPAGVTGNDWRKDPAVLRAEVRFDQRFGGPPTAELPLRDKVRFNVETLTPGEYRIRAFWDRRPARPPNGPRVVPPAGGELPPVLPEPGDYESAETAVFKVAAGETIDDLNIQCTNRVGQADEFYDADRRWAEQHPAGEEVEEEEIRWGGEREKVLVTAPIDQWVIRTNENTGDIHLKSVRLRHFPGARRWPLAGSRSLVIRFTGPAPRNKNNWNSYQARLEDEHGCRFECSSSSGMSRRVSDLHFNVVPYAARQMKLVITLNNPEEEQRASGGARKLTGASFLLTNLCNIKPEDWTAETLPAKRDLDLLSVQLTALDAHASEYTAEYLANFPGGHPAFRRGAVPENKFAAQSKKDGAVWFKLSGKYIDRWGNEAVQPSQFCSAEKVVKLWTEWARDPRPNSFLPDELWEVPVGKVPEGGESVALKLVNEVQGLRMRLYALSGPGEFTYEDGRAISATNELSQPLAARFVPGNRAPLPSIYRVNREGPNYVYYGPRASPWPVTIAARMPHLACRIPDAPSGTLFALLEQDLAAPEPMNAPPAFPGGGYWGGPRNHSAVKFLPLEFRPGEQNKKLTFAVQKTRVAEFVVELPAGARDRSNE